MKDPLLRRPSLLESAEKKTGQAIKTLRKRASQTAILAEELYELEQRQPWYVRLSISSLCIALLAFLVFLAASLFTAPYLRVVPTYVDIPELGRIEGTWYPSSRVFQGIPFGHAERFQPPEMVQPWKPETLSARAYKPACMHPSGPREEGVSEDCLFLNVFTPVWNAEPGSSPVLVWFHGGGYTLGAGSDTAPEDLASLVWTHNLVVVSTNYRLGVFGFSGSEDLRSKDNSTGNYGIQDQRLALEWVQRYISPFGGDPTRVTVIGWSAGAASISVHLTAAKSRGHFARAIMMSGGFTDWAALPMSAAEYAWGNVAACLGCAKEDRTCFLTKSAEAVMQCGQGQWYGPVVDSVDLLKTPLDAVTAGDSLVDYSIPIIIGNTLEDKLMDIGRHADAEKLRRVVENELLGSYGKEDVDKALELYPLTIFTDYALGLFPSEWSPAYWAARVMGADRDFTCVMRGVVEQWTRQGGHAFWYSWLQPQVFKDSSWRALKKASDSNDDKPLGSSCYPCPGAGHGADLAFLFENPSKVDVKGKVVEGDRLTDVVQSLYVNFAWARHSGKFVMSEGKDEAGTSLLTDALPKWHPFDASKGNALRFVAGQTQEVLNYRSEECKFWDAHPKVPR